MKQKLLLSMSLTLGVFTSCTNETKPIDINVMSFNIRYDNPEDGINNWHKRKDKVGQMLNFKNCDLIGTQEVLHNQLQDLQILLPNYEAIGVGREDGVTKGEYSAIFYKKDKFTAIDQGTFWLSETPNIPGSKGWDGACERVATWVHLKDNESHKEFLFINTHLDHVGTEARKKGVDLLQQKAFELSKGLPIIATGDFNAEPSSDVIANITDTSKANYWVHTKDLASSVEGLNWSFHDFDKLELSKRELIDYIFVTPSILVKNYEVLPILYKNKLVSDHAPVIAKVQL